MNSCGTQINLLLSDKVFRNENAGDQGLHSILKQAMERNLIHFQTKGKNVSQIQLPKPTNLTGELAKAKKNWFGLQVYCYVYLFGLVLFKPYVSHIRTVLLFSLF